MDSLTGRPKIQEWLASKKPETIRLYSHQIKRFERLTNTTLETLLEKLENKQIKPTDIRTIIIQASKDLTNPTQVITDAAVRSFFKYWYGKLPETTIKYEETQSYKPYTKDDIEQLIGFTDKLLEKLYITIAYETGLRANTILQIKYKHIHQDLNTREGSIFINFEPSFYKGRKKAGYTFIGTRGRQLIKQAIEQQLIETKPDSKLFTYTADSIRHVIKRARRKANIDPTIHPIHGFRSYFLNQLITAGTHPLIIKMLLGRFDDTDSKHYTSHQTETLRHEYDLAYPYLDHKTNAPRDSIQASLKESQLRDTIEHLNQEFVEAKQDQEKEIKQLKASLARQDKILEQLSNLIPQSEHANIIKQDNLENMIPIGIQSLLKRYGVRLTKEQFQEATKRGLKAAHLMGIDDLKSSD